MALNKEWLAPCGLYCGVCGIMIADRDGNRKFKDKLAAFYGVAPEMLHCRGCLSDDVFDYCKVCAIRTCIREKGYEGCHQCAAFPCERIENFPVPVGRKVMLRAIPQWRELGTEAWVAAEEERYRCPQCGQALFRGAKRCRNCGESVDRD